MKVPGDPLDDVADDARYGIYTFITAEEKPWELKVQEEMQQYKGDPTGALIRYWELQQERNRGVRPARFVRSAIWRQGRRWS